jgi:hypothetical protein
MLGEVLYQHYYIRAMPNELNNAANELQPLIKEIKTLIAEARANIAREVNTAMIAAYWNIGRVIVEKEQEGELKAKYGQRLLPELSRCLTLELGRGYSRSNLYNMRDFYLNFPKFQMPSGKFCLNLGEVLCTLAANSELRSAVLIIMLIWFFITRYLRLMY